MVCQVFTGPLMSSSGPSTKQPLNKDFLSLYNANANKISIFPLQLKRIQWGGGYVRMLSRIKHNSSVLGF